MLQHAGRRSLLLLDELGRGTSTHDGHAIVFAVLHHIALESRSRRVSIAVVKMCRLIPNLNTTGSYHANLRMHIRVQQASITDIRSLTTRGLHGVSTAELRIPCTD